MITHLRSALTIFKRQRMNGIGEGKGEQSVIGQLTSSSSRAPGGQYKRGLDWGCSSCSSCSSTINESTNHWGLTLIGPGLDNSGSGQDSVISGGSFFWPLATWGTGEGKYLISGDFNFLNFFSKDSKKWFPWFSAVSSQY